MRITEKKRILLVDDEEDVLKVIGKRLEKSGYKVLTASSGQKALLVLEKEIPDVILLDICMPEMDGLEVVSQIRKQQGMAALPVIFFTGRDSLEDKLQGFNMGINDYITKPIDHRELLARIEMVLKIHKCYLELSLIDKLTGLGNYNCFDKQFKYTFDLARRYGRVFSLFIIDVDNFKQLNDTFGHLCGNVVLRKISECLKLSLRNVDIIFRYGGDEFAVILPETTAQQAEELLKRLKQKMGIIDFDYKTNSISISLSFGVAAYTQEMQTKEELFNIADKSMYEDKTKKKR